MNAPLLAWLTLALLHASAQAGAACGPIDGVDQVLGASGAFIGELHGSVESPAFLAALSCHAVKSGRPLVVAMEYDAKDQPVLDQFLLAADEAKASAMLTATAHWTENRDGRASAAMRDALLHIRRLARAGHRVKLVAYDLWGSNQGERDRQSADLLHRLRKKETGNTYWIVFGGNVHARKTKGLPFGNAPAGSEDYEPLGFLLRDWHLMHLDAEYRGGSTWACTGPSPEDCKAIELGPRCSADCPKHPIVRLQTTNPAFDGVYDVGSLSVSGPLIRQNKSN